MGREVKRTLFLSEVDYYYPHPCTGFTPVSVIHHGYPTTLNMFVLVYSFSFGFPDIGT